MNRSIQFLKLVFLTKFQKMELGLTGIGLFLVVISIILLYVQLGNGNLNFFWFHWTALLSSLLIWSGIILKMNRVSKEMRKCKEQHN